MDIRSPFKENIPDDKWLNLFQKCWRHRLLQRNLEYVTVGHAKGLNGEVLNGFFTMRENLLDTLGIKDLPEKVL